MEIARLNDLPWKRPLDLTKGNEENEGRKRSPVRETTGALTRQVIRRRFPTDFHFVSFVGSCEVECRLQVDGNGIAQPMPCPFQTSGHSAIESVDFTAKG